jgi:hypothetical protein
VICILEFNSFLAGTGYPTGKNTRAGTGMGKILYPRIYMGNPTGRIFFDGYEYGMVLPDGYVPVAIPSEGPMAAAFVLRSSLLLFGRSKQKLLSPLLERAAVSHPSAFCCSAGPPIVGGCSYLRSWNRSSVCNGTLSAGVLFIVAVEA